MAEDSKDEGPRLDYRSPEELRQVLRMLGQRLHYINRVAMGESRVAWHLAELISAAGRLVPLIEDAEARKAFGDGWTAGTVPRDEQADHLLSLLREQLR